MSTLCVRHSRFLRSVAVKWWLFNITIKAGKRARSASVVANAWNHRADALSSAVALGGVFGAPSSEAQAAGHICAGTGAHPSACAGDPSGGICGFPLLDPVAGLLIAGLIGKSGVSSGYAIGMSRDSERIPYE